MAMTPKYFVLVLAALCLVACETTDIKAPISKRIVRMAPIADEPDARVTMAPASAARPAAGKPAAHRSAARAPASEPVATTEAPTASTATPADTSSTPAPTETLPIEPVPTEPTTMAATPDAPPADPAIKPAVSGFDLSAITDLLRGAIGGMPIWLIALIAVALLAALLFGFGGRKARDPYSGAEPETA
jgi:hypothetical protein